MEKAKWFSSLNVLVVDDSEFDRELICAALKKLGIRKVQTAENGSIATGKVENAVAIGKPFETIFLDWKMPTQDGHGFLKQLRSNFKMRNASVIITTGASGKQDVEEFLEQGADDFVVKPVTFEVLEKKLEAIYKKKNKSAA